MCVLHEHMHNHHVVGLVAVWFHTGMHSPSIELIVFNMFVSFNLVTFNIQVSIDSISSQL